MFPLSFNRAHMGSTRINICWIQYTYHMMAMTHAWAVQISKSWCHILNSYAWAVQISKILMRYVEYIDKSVYTLDVLKYAMSAIKYIFMLYLSRSTSGSQCLSHHRLILFHFAKISPPMYAWRIKFFEFIQGLALRKICIIKSTDLFEFLFLVWCIFFSSHQLTGNEFIKTSHTM